MNEFSIRNKSKAPILTLKQHVLEAFLKARPESVALVLSKYCFDYKQLTGKTIILDYIQSFQISDNYGANKNGEWISKYADLSANLYKIINIFTDGFQRQSISNGLLDDLKIAESFYSMIDAELIKIK